MSSPETEHQAWIKQVLEEGDKEYQAELQRQSEMMVDEGSPMPIANTQQENDLENS